MAGMERGMSPVAIKDARGVVGQAMGFPVSH